MKKVMIIEDDADITRSLSIRLSHEGHQVSAASDAVLAMTQVQKVRPDLILLDISMPGGNGFQVAERVQGVPELAGTPFIFLTASKRPEFRERAEELGASGYFEKPFEAAELMAHVNGVLQEQPV